MTTLRDIQDEQDIWAITNFPDRKPYQPILGALEELGELSHAHLKSEQGIRGTEEEHYAAKIDAVADIIIYLIDYCNQSGIDLDSALQFTWGKVKERDWKTNPINGYDN